MKQPPPKSSLPPWLPESLRQDPKKAGVLGVLVLVLGIVLIRWLLTGGAPAAARADLKPPPSTLKGAAASKKKGGALGLNAASGTTRAWLKSPIQDVSRNLFAIRHEFFPQASGTSQNMRGDGESGASVAPTFWDALQKSRDQAADQKRRREILVDNLQREAAKLRLQSTVMGPEPQAIIGGSLVKEGDSVTASDASSIQFRVLKIEARRVVIEREGIKLEVRMAQ